MLFTTLSGAAVELKPLRGLKALKLMKAFGKVQQAGGLANLSDEEIDGVETTLLNLYANTALVVDGELDCTMNGTMEILNYIVGFDNDSKS